MRPNTDIGKIGRFSCVLIGCDKSEKYRTYKKGLV